MATVRAVYSDVEVYVSMMTNLNWKTMLSLSTTPIHMSDEAAQAVFDRAALDDSLFDLRVEA